MKHNTLFKQLIIFPATGIIYIPIILLIFEFKGLPSITYSWMMFLFGFITFWGGLLLFTWAIKTFVNQKNDKPFTINPPKKLITTGPYAYIRNPMMVGAFAMILGEAFYFESFLLLIWYVFVVCLGVVMADKVESPRLEKAFGEEYFEYKANVPAWFPIWNRISDKLVHKK